MAQFVWHWQKSTLVLACAMALAACGGGSNDLDTKPPADDDHSHPHIETAGRLVALEAGSPQVHVIDLDKGRLLQSFTLDNPTSAIYPSPNNRYAVLPQRAQNQVQFIDGGIWQEDHGNHLHDYMKDPALLPTRLTGSRPTHYERHAGQAALFFDGNTAAGQNASVAVLTDASIGKPHAPAMATQGLSLPMHGTAEPRGDWLLTTWRAEATPGGSTLPSQVELYHRHDDHYHFERRFDEQCPMLHGSYSNEKYSAFGCSDGILVVKQDGDTFTARKIDNPADIGENVRIGAIIGNAHYGKFVGIASPGHLFEIDPEAGRISRIQWGEGLIRRAHAMDAEGENLLVLDSTGTVHILDVKTWRKRAEIAGVIANMPAKAPYPSFAVSAAHDKAWLSDPQGQRLHTIDLDEARVQGSIALNFSPTNMVWLGLPEHKH